jgi:WD40 repeat protein
VQVLSIPKTKRIYAISFSPTGRELAAACGDGFVRIWDTTTGELRRSAATEVTWLGLNVAYLDENRLVIASRELSWWDLRLDRWNTIESTPRNERQLAFSPSLEFMAESDRTNSTDWPGTGLAIHTTSPWEALPTPEYAENTSGGLGFSPDGKLLASSHIVRVGEKERSLGPDWGSYTTNDYDYVVHLREVPNGKILRTIPGWGQGVRQLTFSPDGRYLVGTPGPKFRVWDIEANREVALQKRGTKHFQGLAFTEGGRYLATVSNDETVRLWDAQTWAENATFTWEIGRLLNISIAPDGLRAAAGSDKGRIVIWDLDG